jgi:rhodanese-related sulfurtransferase
MQHVSAIELAAWLTDSTRAKPILLDVREPWEFQLCQIDGSLPMPMNTVPARLPELDRSAAIVCICHHGNRSMSVAGFLERNGFTDVSNLSGGVNGWSRQVDPGMPTY